MNRKVLVSVLIILLIGFIVCILFITNDKKTNEKGDVMLFDNSCLVIFYKSFDTPYSYTKIGHIDNLPDLGNDSVSVKFVQ